MRDFPKKRDTKFAPADQASLVLGLQNLQEAEGIREQAGRVLVNAARKTTPAPDA